MNEEQEQHEQEQEGESRPSSLVQRAERLLTKRNQGILFLLTLVVGVVATFGAITGCFPMPVGIALYVLAAAGFAMTCALCVRALLSRMASVVSRFARHNPIARALMADNRLRTVLTALPGMGLNLVYAVFNGAIGITARSAWYGSLSAYYLLLCAMRFLSVSYAKRVYAPERQDGDLQGGDLPERELTVYRNCGAMLSASSIALAGAVVMLVLGYGGKSYAGLTVYAVATYTFCKLAISIINMVKVRNEPSLLLKTLRNISYSDSLVSLLSLQTALFAAFGQDAGELVPRMNALTGAVVCLMILGVGFVMVHDARKLQSGVRTEEETKE